MSGFLIFIGFIFLLFIPAIFENIFDNFSKIKEYEKIKKEKDEIDNYCLKLYKKIFKIHDRNFITNWDKYCHKSIDMISAIINKLENKNSKKFDELKQDCNQRIDNIINERCQDRLYRLIEQIVNKEFEDYDNLIVHLENKNNPAYSAAKKVQEAKNKAKEFETKYKMMKYEYDILFDLFPELENYLERYVEKTDDFQENQTLEDIKEDYDYVSMWISQEEYEKLSDVERNQLALDRYIESRNKSKWKIGRDYELSVGYEYTNKGYNVQYFGIEKKLEDMGRDIIAENDKEVLIIQCKYWSKEKIIHEKHICQLYGTTIQYKKQTKTKKKVIPVFVTSTKLSDTALDFAEYLKVKVIQNREFKEFPRIKCNIGKNGSRIYHLPFDQQYDKTKINKPGESFEYKVAQAVSKGFTRAKKWYPQIS